MKTQALVSALLLANPVAALAGDELVAAKRDAIAALESRSDLVSTEFRSKKTYKTMRYTRDADGELVEKEAEVFYRLKFIPAGVKGGFSDGTGYEFDGEGVLDYEVLVEEVDTVTGDTSGLDNTYFAKKDGGSKLKFYDCDSTKRCSEDYGNTKAYVFASPEGTGLKIKNSDEVYLGSAEEKEILFFQVK